MTEIDTNDVRCYPFPRCPDYKQCAHAGNNKAVMAMNAMPYRIEGEPCKWFVQRVEDEAYSDADDVLRPRVAELETKLSLYENLTAEYGLSMFADISESLKDAQDISALKDKWYRRGIAGYQEAIKKEREECEKVCIKIMEREGNTAFECVSAIRARSIQPDNFIADAICRNVHCPDPNVESVRARLLDRAAAGLLKYGTDTTRTDLTRAQWLRHAQEEALDFAVYLEKLIADDEQAEKK